VRLGPGTTKNRDALGKLGKICSWVFFHYTFRKNGKPSSYNGKGVGAFNHSWETACKAAGLPGRLMHDFRHTAVRNLERAGVPERVAMQLTGHKIRSFFERYNIVSAGALRDAATGLDSCFEKELTKNLTLAKKAGAVSD